MSFDTRSIFARVLALAATFGCGCGGEVQSPAPPDTTVIGLTLATLIGGTVIFEQLFSIPGLGRHLILAVAQKDFAVVQGVALFFSIAVISVNLIVDVSYTVLDPRART